MPVYSSFLSIYIIFILYYIIIYIIFCPFYLDKCFLIFQFFIFSVIFNCYYLLMYVSFPAYNSLFDIFMKMYDLWRLVSLRTRVLLIKVWLFVLPTRHYSGCSVWFFFMALSAYFNIHTVVPFLNPLTNTLFCSERLITRHSRKERCLISLFSLA